MKLILLFIVFGVFQLSAYPVLPKRIIYNQYGEYFDEGGS